MPKRVFTIPEPFDYQRESIEAEVRFQWKIGGRRSGKSLSDVWRQAGFLWRRPNTNNWMADQTLRDATKWFRFAVRLLPPQSIKDCNKSERRIELRNGSIWEFKSAQEPDALRGAGLDSFVGHEAAFWNPESWLTVRPALSDRLGWAALNSTPRGRKNWFTNEWMRAHLEPQSDVWESSRQAFHWPTSLNPQISKFDIEDARQTMPDAMFRQEYLGEFIDASGSLFNPSAKCWSGLFEEPVANARYAAGVDLAKRRDWTAWFIVRIDCIPWRVVEFGRMQKVEYTQQAAFLAPLLKRYNNAFTFTDQYQETVVELLNAAGCQVEIFPLTSASRPTILQNFAVVLEQGQIRYPATKAKRERAGLGATDPWNDRERRHVEALDGEIDNFTPEITKRGNVRYEASHGFNDDLVFAGAMACQSAKEHRSGGGEGSFLSGGGRRGGW